jgi:glycosyltransferase involved in cell wall biosynthesis
MADFNCAVREARRIANEQAEQIKSHVLEPIRLLTFPKPDEVIAVIVCRNEALRLPACLKHYRQLGVRRFAVIDNGSTDATRSFLMAEVDTDVYGIESGYPEARSGCYWRNRLYHYYGLNRWYLSIDADELLVYEGMDHHGLKELAALLQMRGAKSLVAFLIDMYADRPFSEITYSAGDSMIDACPYFDSDYSIRRWGSLPWITGGPRDRLTPGAAEGSAHNLRKFPFFYWDRTSYRKNNHEFSAFDDHPMDSGALLHFKMLPDFESKVDQAIAAQNHWMGAEFYRRYKSGIDDGRLASPFYEGSRLYKCPQSLIDQKLMTPIAWPGQTPRPKRWRDIFRLTAAGRSSR